MAGCRVCVLCLLPWARTDCIYDDPEYVTGIFYKIFRSIFTTIFSNTQSFSSLHPSVNSSVHQSSRYKLYHSSLLSNASSKTFLHSSPPPKPFTLTLFQTFCLNCLYPSPIPHYFWTTSLWIRSHTLIFAYYSGSPLTVFFYSFPTSLLKKIIFSNQILKFLRILTKFQSSNIF